MKLYLSFLFIVVGINLKCQINFNRYTTAEGLPYDITYEMYQDHQGFLWIGTEIGLAKYDGISFQLFNDFNDLPTNTIVAIDGINDDFLALGTWGGGMQLIDFEGKLKYKPSLLNLNRLKSLSSNNNYIYSSTYYSLVEFDIRSKDSLVSNFYSIEKENDRFEFYPGQIKKVNSTQYRFNTTVVDNKVYYFYEPKRTTHATNYFTGVLASSIPIKDTKDLNQVFTFLNSKKISCFSKYLDHFVAGTSDTLFYFDDKEISRTIPLDINGSYILKILFYDEDEFVFTSINEKGIKFVYLYNKGILTNLNNTLGLKNSVSDILIDHEKSIWISSYGDGLFYIPYKAQNYKYIDRSQFSDPNIQDICVDLDKNMKLLSTDYIYTATLSGEIISKKRMNLECQEIRYDKGQLLAFCSSPTKDTISRGILHLHGYKTRVVDGIGTIEFDKENITVKGVKKNTIFDIGVQHKSIGHSTTKDCMWLSDFSSVMLFNYKKDIIVQSYNLSESFCNNRISKILEVGDTVWVATENCLNFIHNSQVEKYDLLNNEKLRIFDIVLDDQNTIWVATHAGVFNINDKGNKRINQETGLASDYAKSICLDPDGSLWVSGNAGVTIITPDHLDSKVFPKINIKQDQCQFTINAISYKSPKAIEIEYRLNKQQNWTPVHGSQLTFCDYKVNDYLIEFRYRLIDSEWAPTLKYKFVVAQIWYKSWWAITTLVILILGLVTIFFTYLLRISKRRNELLTSLINERSELEDQLANSRNTIAMDFHDDMGNKMARISLLSDIISKDSSFVNENTKQKLDQIKKDTDILYKNTRDFIWSLKKNSNLLDEVIIYLSDFGEDFFNPLGIDFDINKTVPSNLTFPLHYSRQIIMICKEIMTNAAKHAMCNLVILSFEYQAPLVTITIQDNGVGFSMEDFQRARGIHNIIERAKKINGNIEFESSTPGTLVRLKISIE